MRRPFRRRPAPLAPSGWEAGPASPVDRLDADDLALVNRLLPWQCFTTDGLGRRVGDRAWAGKREEPQPIPDRRIGLMDARWSLRGRSVLELGCFEGVHTIGLVRAGASVVGIDARVENVAKSAVRCALYGATARLEVRDLERPDALDGIECDFAHHVGVLYHLADPVGHLLDLGRHVTTGVMLDTHVADGATDSYDVEGRSWPYLPYREGGRADVFSGMVAEARWLPLDTLVEALGVGGFDAVEVVETRAERNGTRVLLVAERTA